ncbi:hypothetical protein [uncultured Senegalimassilia sp.]|uniref:beta strand repeat-containing protein n=1 Tax=uncultured Senegalimassilia sp. TaxID=1714350 RepID=UPI0025E88DEE|nr:hypothetical protein [uncultured Senegalimassilia sp.]
MRSVKRILAVYLTFAMAFQLFAPTTGALAEELNVVSDATAQQAGSSESADGGGSSADAGAASGDGASASDDASAGGSETASDDAASGDAAAGDASESQEPAADESASAGDDAADVQDAPAMVAAGATIATVAELKKAMGDHGDVTATGDIVTAITFNDAVGLRIISNADPQLYQTATLTRGGQTGDALDLSSPEDGYTFLGFGSESCPFKGSFDTNGTSIALATSLFNNVELNSGIHIPNLIWKGKGSEPLIAANVAGGGQDLTVTIQIADPVSEKVQESTAGITSALLGTVTGSLTLGAAYSFTGTRKGLGATADATGNVGLLANTVANGSTFTVESVIFPDNVASGGTVSATNGNAGLLVGAVNDGAFLHVGSLSNVPTATVQSSDGCAGGVVGKVGSNTGATVEVTSEIDLSSLTVKGTAAAGGFIGQATKLTLNQGGGAKVTCPKTVGGKVEDKDGDKDGDKDSGNVGGFIGEVSFGSSVAFTGNDQIDTGDGVTLAGKADESKGVGAAIGKLNFDSSTVTVSFKDGTFKSTYGNGSAAAVFGGLVGSVTGRANSKPLRIESVTTEFALEASPNFTGGLVGWLGRGTGATLEVKNASVNCTKLVQSGKGFGGVAGCIDNASIADINGITVQNKEEITKGAGIAAESWRSAIRLGGVTDFSGMSIAENDAVAQIALVRADAPTLVFARGTGSDTDTSTDDCWVYKRCAAKKVDDLGGAKGAGWGYGQVIRLDGDTLKKDLIKINMDEHKLEGPSTTDWRWQIGFDTETKWSEGNRVLNIKSTQDFVCLALSVQFANLWNGVYGFGATDGSALLGSDVTINLNADVNLSGTGVVGLGFDSANKLQTFRGTFNGNNRKITLAIGEPYGMRDNTAIKSDDAFDGNGKIYRHSRLGLFAAIGGDAKAKNPTATVNNLTVDGSIKFDNGLGVDSGSLAATITGNATLNGVTCKPAITCDDTFANEANIGGIAGSVSGGGTVTFDSSNMSGSTKAQSTINTGATLNGNTRIGGAIGYVADVAAIVNVVSLEVGGATASDNTITASNSASGKIAQVGGFIGCIAQSTYNKDGKIISSAEKNVSITGLSFDSFNMTVGKNGDAKNGAGGLLGYSWGNAVVTIGDSSKNTNDSTYALKTTNNASITARSSTELGGLVYAASGHWIINDYAIDLLGTTINADKANVLGLLIGRGSRVENSATYGAETYSGLYLENRASWDTAYKVHDDATGNGVAINNTAISSKNSATSFDEWVGNSTRPAYGNKAGSKLMDGEWNTVVSLHTQDEKLHMSDDSGSDNSYHNRSVFGQNHNTNAWTRYYYNLDRAYTEVGNNSKNSSKASYMDSPEYLLLWCAYLYAPSDIRGYIIPGNQQIFQGNNIGANDGARVSIDMDGYSFYPSNPASGSKVTVKNADIKFHYSEIKAKQDGNKKNSEATQHENMHCGLIRTHAGDLTVSNVTLGGTVGSVVNDAGSSSGALVCRYIFGTSGAVKQISIDGLTLDGLTVDGVADKAYAPLLINEMQTYVNLSANNISTTGYADNTKAATSLFGKLGVGSTADQVTATFSLINLPSAKDSSIFTHASLLESFGYGEGKTGSAVYTFVKNDQTNNKVTFGSEIDSKGEYSGKQLWYYDEDTYETEAGLVSDGKIKANADTPQFGGYLPYVYKGKANESNVQYHEIKVNQRVPKLTTGCGTYGDPYAITKASELNVIAEYINTQNAIDGWEVTITRNQEMLCQRRSSSADTGNEVTYVYNQAKKTWEKKTGEGTTDPNDTLDDATMHSYLQSAYYSIEPKNEDGAAGTIELDAASFQGLGNLGNPFRGVIVGDLANEGQQATIAINNSTSFSKGLIPYSYGGVVKNLKVVYQSNVSGISYTGKDSNGVPGSFFGGVIGCILGGDNIIDGVIVSSQSGAAATVASANADPLIAAVADSLTNPHLTPIGGYVGAVAGGGVIFRNSSGVSDALNSWHVAGASRYDNPYVGRVIDGYAFSELGDSKSLDNTDRNYKINNLNTGDRRCVVTGDTQGRYRGVGGNDMAITTTVKDSQGLLVLSAIISSGAAGGSANTKTTSDEYGTYAGSRAYLGGSNAKGAYQFGNQQYGKVRNASYEYVGKPGSADSDFANAKNDDMKSPGIQSEGNALDYTGDGLDVNSPYLIAKYATWQTGNICAAQVSGMDLQFVNTTYDMTPYGTGYTGLSGRYYSNACASDKGADRDRIVPLVATINGNGATIKVGDKGGTAYDIKEYANDDYKLTGVGALFGTVTYTSTNVGGNIGTAAAATGNGGYTVQNLKFEGCNISLTYTDASGKASGSGDEQVGVGLLAGTTANASSLKDYGKYHAVTLANCKVNGSAGVSSVGGLLGSSGYGSRSTNKNDKTWIVNKTGGQPSPVKLYNCSYSDMDISGVKNVGGFVGKLNSGSQGGIWTTGDMDIAKGSKLTASSGNPRVGGVVGVSGGAIFVNADTTNKESTNGGKATIYGLTLTVPKNADPSSAVGGLVGRAENSICAYNLTVTGDANDKKVFGQTETGTAKFKNVGGIAGNIAGGSEFKFDTCEVSNIDLESREVSGGISGNISGSPAVICNNVQVSGMTFGSSYSGGINGSLRGTPTFNITNTVIKNNVFKNSNNNSHSGGLGGDGRGVFKLSNVLLDSNDFQGKNGQGIFFGDTKAGLRVYAAGIDIKPGGDKTTGDLPPLMLDTTKNQDNVKLVNKVSYVAFGDYEDKLAAPDSDNPKTLYSDDDAAGYTTTAASPYVTTSPVSDKIAVRVSDTDTTDRYLFGDGANVDLASTIQDQAGKDVPGRYTYTNIGGRDDSGAYQNTNGYSTTSAQSYNSENSDASKQVANDFKVLEIPGQDTTTVTNYLNLVTNGGFSDAVRLNNGSDKQYVTAKAEKFELDETTKAFVKSADPASLSVVGNGTNSMQFRASSNWDNDKGQFTLLSVTFNDGAGHTYKVQVPIVVKRLFEVNFAATYTYGTNFKADDYSYKNDHVLTGVGDAMTGYLTWTYNKARATETEYGWNTYLQGGGSMMSPNKTLLFGGDGKKGTLPAGTQLTLVDTANNNKEYHYTVGDGGAASVALIDFVDSDGKHYEEQWLSELMGVKASSPTASGAWVKTNADDLKAGARIKTATGYDYFRPWTSGDTGDRYDLALEGGSEPHPSESFFLVVRVPQGSTATVNGYTGTSLSGGVNTRINYVKRSNESETDSHDNTASTYSVASGYNQTLIDNRQNADGTEGTQVMSVDTTNSFTMDVTDTVDCGKNEYNSSDTLYYQLNSSLASYSGSALTGASGYPSGTSGTYSFYVKVGDTYYKPSKSTDSAGNVKWSWEPAGEGEAAVSGKSWSADGGDMQLVLSDSKGTPIDLSGIRKIATDAANAAGANALFSIQMKADLRMSGPACQNAIAASEDASAYTKPTYRSFLSPHADTLSTSTMAKDNEGKMRYYRKGGGASTIALTATKKTQLGINVDDLGTADGTIALAATYDLSKLSGADEKLGKAEKATFTLTLQKREEDGSYKDVPGIGDYLSVQQCAQLGMDNVGVSDDRNSIVFTDAASKDVASNSVLATRDGSSPILRLSFVVKVNTDVESAQHFYANYRLVMTAHLSGEGVDDTPVNASGSIAGYANSDYVTYTLTRVHMEGISHG